jgi:hypothetical protein
MLEKFLAIFLPSISQDLNMTKKILKTSQTWRFLRANLFLLLANRFVIFKYQVQQVSGTSVLFFSPFPLFFSIWECINSISLGCYRETPPG